MTARHVLMYVACSEEALDRPTDSRGVDTDLTRCLSHALALIKHAVDDILALAWGEVCIMTSEVRHRLRRVQSVKRRHSGCVRMVCCHTTCGVKERCV